MKLIAARVILLFILAGLFSLSGIAPVTAAPARNVIFILDGSGSMWAQTGGDNRVVHARAALSEAFKRYRGAFRLGVMSFGHSGAATCSGVRMAVPVGEIEPATYDKILRSYNPKGAAPIGDALKAAAKELRTEARPATIILLADGADTCNKDACAIAREINDSGLDVEIEVVSFGVRRSEETAELSCIATATGGAFLTASNRAELDTALERAFDAATVRAGAMALVEARSARSAKAALLTGSVPPGITGSTEALIAAGILKPGETPYSTPDIVPVPLDKPERYVDKTPLPPEPVKVVAADPVVTGSTGKPDAADAAGEADPKTGLELPPKKPIVKLDMVPRQPTAPVVVAPEFIVEREQAASSGLKLKARLARPLAPIRRPLSWKVYQVDKVEPEKWIEVAAKESAEPTLELGPGDYVVRASYGYASASKIVTIEETKLTVATFILNVGGLRVMPALAALDAPEGTPVEQSVFAETETKDAAKPVARVTKPGSTLLLNAGQYRLMSKFGKANAVVTTRIDIKPGRLTEVEINHKAGIVRFNLIDKDSGEPVGKAMWQLVDGKGKLVTETDGPAPQHILAPGSYTITARHGAKSYSSAFDVSAGEIKAVKINAQ